MKKILFLCGLSAILTVSAAGTDVNEVWGSAFTQEENEYIEQKKVLKAAVIDNWQPLLTKEEDQGAYAGLGTDVLARISDETGLEIEYVEAKDYLDAVNMTVKGETDIFPAVVSYKRAENVYDMDISKPYLSAQMIMIYSKDTKLEELKNLNVAEVKGYPVFTARDGIEHMGFERPEECLMAVRSGHADAMYCDIFTGMNYLQRYRNKNLLSFPLNTETTFGMGVSRKDGEILTGIVNRVIVSLDRKMINDSLTYNRIDPMQHWDDFVYRYPFEVICVCLAGAFLIILISSSYFRIKSRQSVALKGYTDSYCLLADTFGEAGFDYDYAEDRMTVFGKHAYKISMPSAIENFSAYLEQEDKEISLTKESFEKMIEDGMSGESYEIELECRMKDGEWQHFSLFYSVLSTDEAYKRPIRMVGCLNNMELRYKEKERLRHLGMYDALTGLYNRTGMEWEMKERLERNGTTDSDMLLVIDVDNFKQFNDEYGHQCGDEVLRFVGQHLQKTFRQDDVLCRWGGDEFLLYLIGAASHAELIEMRCHFLLKRMEGFRYEDKNIMVTLSIGGAVVGERSFEDAFQEADKALYTVKENGRNSVCILTE